jgi:signal transduction histidine kinase
MAVACWSTGSVANAGAVLDRAAVPELFHRGEHTRGHSAAGDRDYFGTGLGLSIVYAVVHAHGGQITANPRTSGGLQITVRFPMNHP